MEVETKYTQNETPEDVLYRPKTLHATALAKSSICFSTAVCVAAKG